MILHRFWINMQGIGDSLTHVLVPMLCVGTVCVTLCVAAAERRKMRDDAEHRHERNYWRSKLSIFQNSFWALASRITPVTSGRCASKRSRANSGREGSSSA